MPISCKIGLIFMPILYIWKFQVYLRFGIL